MSTPQYGERREFGADDVCYRHPNAHSFTLCQRCGRTICPQCQNVSAVGVLCPDCVREAAPAPVKRIGRGARAARRRLFADGVPVVTYGLMALCVLVWAGQMIGSWLGGNAVTYALWYAPVYSLPDSVSGLVYSDVSFQPWRLLTVIFTHSVSSPLHIAFNMFALWIFGRNLEQILGRLWFFLLYLFAGVGGSLAVMLWVYVEPTAVSTPTVGASGAIFGVMAATVVAYRAANVNVTSLVVLIGINIAIGFLPGTTVSWQAHIGGALVGAAVMSLLLATRGPRREKRRQWSMIGVGVLLVALGGLYWVVQPALPWA